MRFFSVTASVLLVARARSRDDNCVLMSDRVTIARITVSAAGAETGTRHQQRKQQRRRQAAIRSRHCSGGRAGSAMRRIPPSRKTVRRGLEFQDATDMCLPEAARCQVRIMFFTYPIVKFEEFL